MSIFSDIGKAVGSVVSSPVVRTVATGAAFVYPPVGVPAAIAVNAAAKITAASKSRDPRKRRVARKTIINTALAAKKGDLAARRGLQTLAIAARAQKAVVPMRRPPTFVSSRSRVKGRKPRKMAGPASGILFVRGGGIKAGKFKAA